jgi:fibronectin type 3 domain-containing protein
MSNPRALIKWASVNKIEEGYRIYRSDTYFDENNLPVPLAVLNRSKKIKGGYNDTTVILGSSYWYRVGVFAEEAEILSDALSITAREAPSVHVYSGSQDNTVRKIDPYGNQVWSFYWTCELCIRCCC